MMWLRYSRLISCRARRIDTNDTLSVTNVTVLGDAVGITVNDDHTLSVDPSAYTSLAAGATEVIAYSYNVVNLTGETVSQTATITITGTNNGPVVSGGVDLGQILEDGSRPITKVELLHHAIDAEGDALQVENVALTDSSRAHCNRPITVGSSRLWRTSMVR